MVLVPKCAQQARFVRWVSVNCRAKQVFPTAAENALTNKRTALTVGLVGLHANQVKSVQVEAVSSVVPQDRRSVATVVWIQIQVCSIVERAATSVRLGKFVPKGSVSCLARLVLQTAVVLV